MNVKERSKISVRTFLGVIVQGILCSYLNLGPKNALIRRVGFLIVALCSEDHCKWNSVMVTLGGCAGKYKGCVIFKKVFRCEIKNELPEYRNGFNENSHKLI